MEPEGGTEPNGSPKEDDWKKTISGGYDCKFVEQPPTVFQTDCPVCCLLLRDPYQATCCGTSFCCSCIEQLQVCNNLCPTCRKDNFEVSPNKGLKRSLNQLQVFCAHRKDGCTWTGELGELDHHLIKVIHVGKSFQCEDHRAQLNTLCPKFIRQETVIMLLNEHNIWSFIIHQHRTDIWTLYIHLWYTGHGLAVTWLLA